MTPRPPAREGVGAVLGRIPSGLFIVSAGTGGAATGILASWVQQAAFDPPSLSVALQRERPVLAVVRAEGRFLVSLVGRGQMRLVSHFARGFAPGEAAFDDLEARTSPSGIPYPAEALGWLECRLSGSVEAGDHVVLIGEADAGALAADAPPHVHLRKSGFGY